MEKYKELAEDLYIEPAEKLVGLFLDPVQKDHSITTSYVLQRDIRIFFNEAPVQKDLQQSSADIEGVNVNIFRWLNLYYRNKIL